MRIEFEKILFNSIVSWELWFSGRYRDVRIGTFSKVKSFSNVEACIHV